MSLMDLEECELECLSVRKGDITRINDLSEPFLEQDRGLLVKIFKGDKQPVQPELLLASSESLIAKGFAREGNEPLKRIIEMKRASRELRDVSMARAAQNAVMNGLPMDLGPLISELGLSRGDLGSALKNIRRKREKRKSIPEMEKRLLSAMLLDERAEQVESGSLGRDHIKGALEGFEEALSLSTEIDGEVGEYHRNRCMFHLGTFLLKRGEILKGMDALDICRKKAENEDHRILLMDILRVHGFYKEDLDECAADLEKAGEMAGGLGNTQFRAEVLFIKGQKRSSESGDPDTIGIGIEEMLKAADLAEKAGLSTTVMAYGTEAALWLARSGAPKRGVDHAKKAAAFFKREKDRPSMIRARCILFLCYMRMDERRKAKRLLLDLVANEPVKQFPSSFGLLKEAVSGAEWLRKDRDTRELFEDEIVYTIEREAVDEIIQRAKEAYPNEFGAMLRGLPHITHIEPVMEGAGNRNSFLFSLYSRFSQRNVPGEGVVHSHPSGSARPSRADLSMFGRFPGINIIIGYPYRYDSMAAYDRLGNRVKLEIVKAGRGIDR